MIIGNYDTDDMMIIASGVEMQKKTDEDIVGENYGLEPFLYKQGKDFYLAHKPFPNAQNPHSKIKQLTPLETIKWLLTYELNIVIEREFDIKVKENYPW